MKLIAIEGPDGSGKSSVCQKLKEWEPTWHFTSEPSQGVLHGMLCRAMLRNEIDYYPKEALLYNMLLARYEHLHELSKLPEDKVVVTDRYLGSTLVYQQEYFEASTLKDLCRYFRVPDLTVILLPPFVTVLDRVQARRAKTGDTEPYERQLGWIWRKYSELAQLPSHPQLGKIQALTASDDLGVISLLVQDAINRVI